MFSGTAVSAVDIENLSYSGIKLLGHYLLGFESHLKIFIQSLNILDYAGAYNFFDEKMEHTGSCKEATESMTEPCNTVRAMLIQLPLEKKN